MNNELQKTVTAVLLIISFSIGYYFLGYLPRQEKREVAEQMRKEEIASVQKCEQIGSARYEKDKKDSVNMVMSPEYRFKKDTNQCLYKGGDISPDGYVTQYIYDLYTNKEIVSYSTDVKGNILLGSQIEFKNQEYLLFKK